MHQPRLGHTPHWIADHACHFVAGHTRHFVAGHMRHWVADHMRHWAVGHTHQPVQHRMGLQMTAASAVKALYFHPTSNLRQYI